MAGKTEKSPLQAAFEKNLKFLNQESYPEDFFRGLFGAKLTTVAAGAVDFPTGRVVLAARSIISARSTRRGSTAPYLRAAMTWSLLFCARPSRESVSRRRGS